MSNLDPPIHTRGPKETDGANGIPMLLTAVTGPHTGLHTLKYAQTQAPVNAGPHNGLGLLGIAPILFFTISLFSPDFGVQTQLCQNQSTNNQPTNTTTNQATRKPTANQPTSQVPVHTGGGGCRTWEEGGQSIPLTRTAAQCITQLGGGGGKAGGMVGRGNLYTRQPHTTDTHGREEGRSNTPTSWCHCVPTS